MLMKLFKITSFRCGAAFITTRRTSSDASDFPKSAAKVLLFPQPTKFFHKFLFKRLSGVICAESSLISIYDTIYDAFFTSFHAD